MLKTTESSSKTTENRKFHSEFQRKVQDFKERKDSLGPQASKVLLQELNSFLVSSVSFITNYDLEVCRNTLAELGSSIQKVEKKKFAFKKSTAAKPVVKKAEPASVKQQKDELVKNDSNTGLDLVNNTPILNQLLWITDENTKLSTRPLQSCLVIVSGNCTNLFILKATDCVFIFARRIGTYGMIQHTKNCLVYLHGIGQLRCHDCFDMKVFGWVDNNPIIEDCKNVAFGEMRINFPVVASSDEPRISSDCVNNVLNVQDFNWLSQSKSPNVNVINTEDVLEEVKSKLFKIFQDSQPESQQINATSAELNISLEEQLKNILSCQL